MKIVIVGPGAIGCLLASFLSKGKDEVWLLDKDGERASKINKNGISIEGISGEWNVKGKATTDVKNIGSAELVIIAVKSYDTKEAISAAKPLISDDTSVLTLQNGLGNIEIISEAVGQEKVIGGVTNLGATLLETGKVRHAGKGETIIGRIDGNIPVQMRQIREIFNACGLETRISKDIKRYSVVKINNQRRHKRAYRLNQAA